MKSSYRLWCLTLLVLGSFVIVGCASFKPILETDPSMQDSTARKPQMYRITLRNSSQLILENAVAVGDSIVGQLTIDRRSAPNTPTYQPPLRVAVAKSDIVKIEIRDKGYPWLVFVAFTIVGGAVLGLWVLVGPYGL